MKKFMKIIALCSIFMLGACAQTQTDTKSTKETEKTDVTIVLDWTPNTNHTGIYTAIEKGYFAEQGLNVSVVQPPEDGAELTVGSGKAQFGISFQDTLASSFTKDIPVTAVAAVVAHNTSGILTLKSDHITTPKDLEGKTYATWDLPIEKAIIKNIVEKDGGDFSKVNLVPSTVTDIVSALNTNIDAVWVFEGWDGVAAKLNKLDTNYVSFRDLNGVFDYYTPVLIANNETIKNNPELVKKFVLALSKGYTYSASHPEETANFLLKHAPELNKDLVLESQKYLSQYYIDGNNKWGYINPTRWNAFYNWLNEQNLVDKKINENTGFTNDFINN